MLPLHELTEISVCLAIVGGFLDAYTFLFHGGVFANAQTGNMVLMGISIAQGNFARAGYYIIPILAFFCGIMVTELIKRRYSDENFDHWQHITLGLELVLLVIIAFLPKQVPDVISNVTVSFVCSLQVNSFGKVQGLPYASTMCTGNLRSAAVHLGRYLYDGQKDSIKSSARYFIVIFAFCCGAALGSVITNIFGGKSVLLCSFILLVLLCVMLMDRRKIKRAQRKRKKENENAT